MFGRAPGFERRSGCSGSDLPGSGQTRSKFSECFFSGAALRRRAIPQSILVSEAVRVAKAVKKPVKVIWTGEDDVEGGYYRPLLVRPDCRRARCKRQPRGMEAHDRRAVDHRGVSLRRGMFDETRCGCDVGGRRGRHSLCDYQTSLSIFTRRRLVCLSNGGGRSAVLTPLLSSRVSSTNLPVLLVQTRMSSAAVSSPSMRGARLSWNLQRKGGLAEAPDKGMRWGIAVHESFGSIVAQVAEVSVNPAGRVHVHKVVCAVDCGIVVNPEIVKAQMESGIVFGLSAVLHGAITFKEGRVEQGNFNDYPILRMYEMPAVEVFITPSEEPPGGVGEPGVPPIAPAVGNAIFAATGKRIRRLPIRAEELKKG